jgi:uncharacterized protein YjbI with pentapeptide repeats
MRVTRIDRSTLRSPGSRRRVGASVLCVIAVACLLAGCGGDGGGSAAAPETPPAGGISETFLVEHPHAALNATHTVVLDLSDAPGTPDTGSEPGVDEVPYHFSRRTLLTLAVDDALDPPPQLTLLDGMGAAVLEVGESRRSQTALVFGAYTLRVEGAPPSAPVESGPVPPPAPLFLRPTLTVGGGANAADVARVEAGESCPNCDLRDITLTGTPLQLYAVDLSGADFTGASLTSVAFFGTDLTGAIFDQTRFDATFFASPILTRASFAQAEFRAAPTQSCDLPSCRTHQDLQPDGCCVIQCNNEILLQGPPASLAMASFSGATFASSCLYAPSLGGASFAGATFDFASSVGGDFAGSDLRGARFDGTDVMGRDASGEPQPDVSPAAFAGATVSDDVAGAAFAAVDLTGIDFQGTDLRQASFTGSTLTETTNFAGADFSSSDFAGVDLSQTDLSTATLSPATSFAGATLSAGSHGVNLACLPGGTGGCAFPQQTTQFKGANLAYVNLNGAGLEEANLERTILDNASLIGARLNLSNLKDASLRGIVAGVQPDSGAQVTELGGAYMVNADLTNADLRSADLSGAHLYGTATLTGVLLDSADLSQAICAGAAFSGSLTDAAFNNAVLVNATFNGANLTGAKFDTAYLQGADFSSASSVLGASLRNAAVSTEPGAWTFTEQDGTPFTFAYGATALGALATDPSVICPDSASGPCGPGTLTPNNGPFPPQPPCIPSEQFCYENCLNPPNFKNHPPCE